MIGTDDVRLYNLGRLTLEYKRKSRVLETLEKSRVEAEKLLT